MIDNSGGKQQPETPRPHWNCAHRNYRLTCGEFDQLRRRAGDKCEICRSGPMPGPRGMLFIDHDEMKGKWAVRGLLCNTCNSSLGLSHFAASRKAQAYLANPFRTEEPESRRKRKIPGPEPLFSVRIADADYAKTVCEPQRRNLYAAGQRYHRAVRTLEAARLDLDAAIIAAIEVGGTQSDVVRLIGMTRESVRQVVLDHRRQARKAAS